MLSVILFNGVLEKAGSVLQLKIFRRDKKGLLCEFYLLCVFVVVVVFSLNLRNHRVTFRNKNRQKLPGLVNRLISQADRPVATLFQGPPLTNQ